MRTQEFDVDISQVGRLGNAFLEELNKLRELDPVHWSAASRCWLITRHADVDDALQGKLPLSLKRNVNIIFGGIPEEERAKRFPTLMRYIPDWIIEQDPPEHPRLRKLLVKAFNKKVVDSVRPFVRERVALLMDKLERQPQLEFNEEIARLLPGSVILKLLGLSQDYFPKLRGWSAAFMEGIGVPYADMAAKKRADDAMAEMNAVFAAEIDERRRSPRDDLLSSMLAATEDGETLTEIEMLGALQVLIVAGHDTTSNTMTLGLAALAEHPDFWDYMYRRPEKTLECCLELMRYIAMSTSQPRIAAEDFTWHGKQLRKGDLIFLMLAAANRDPRAFENPEAMDVHRNNERSMVFAPGLHHCIGHLLAKMQVADFFGELVQRFEGAEILDPRLAFMPQVAFRGLYELNVRLKPRQ
ncbi:MAG TPA: cytochrome P450 [Steroidobacteraceae bacterium]|nr:cytochrome P450 [Steroidobacteraceae bacterium]